MKVGAWYVVTKGSDDGTFEVGDHITPCRDGSIGCKEAEGWIESEDAEKAMRGVEVKVDAKWLARRKARLLADLAKLEELE